MVEEAYKEAEYLNKSKEGQKTRIVAEDHNVYGSLAHQAVEAAFEDAGLQYTSFRQEKYKRGDKYDIAYENDRIDVKGTHGVLNQWYYNKQFLVFQHQIDNPKFELTTHLTFVMVHPGKHTAYIFGIIERDEFMEKCEAVKIKYDNQGIRAYHLKPFRQYMFRS